MWGTDFPSFQTCVNQESSSPDLTYFSVDDTPIRENKVLTASAHGASWSGAAFIKKGHWFQTGHVAGF
jgi:hypothetical protein